MDRDILVKEYASFDVTSQDAHSFLKTRLIPLLNQYYGFKDSQKPHTTKSITKATVGFLEYPDKGIATVPRIYEL